MICLERERFEARTGIRALLFSSWNESFTVAKDEPLSYSAIFFFELFAPASTINFVS